MKTRNILPEKPQKRALFERRQDTQEDDERSKPFNDEHVGDEDVNRHRARRIKILPGLEEVQNRSSRS